MATLTYLDSPNSPPEDHEWVSVEGEASGFYMAFTSVFHGTKRALLRDGPFVRLPDAIERAQDLAEKHHISDIYIKGIPSA